MKSISDRKFTKFEGEAQFKIDENAAVCALDCDGNMHLYIPANQSAPPEHVVALTAMSVYFAEHFTEVMDWWTRRIFNAH